MKGLLLKDYYLIKSVLFIMFSVFIIVGGSVSFLTSPWALTVIATVMFGMISITTINMDKTSGWRKAVRVMPVSKKTALDSKYVLYLLLSGIGFILGITLGMTASLIKNQFDIGTMLLFISVSAAIALLSGSITIPCSFILGEEKSMISLLAAYPLSTAIFTGAVLLFDNKQTACRVTVALGIMLFTLSWILSGKTISGKDIT